MENSNNSTRIEITAPSEEEGQKADRIDRWLASALTELDDVPRLSRNRLKSLILEGQVSEDGVTITNPSATVKHGLVYAILVPEAEPAEPEAQDIALDVVFEDQDLIIVNKPAGMTVHPAPGSPDGTLVNALLAHCGDSLSGIGGVKRPGIVHRIDKDTSGLLVVAKNDEAHHALSDQFSEHEMKRRYIAVVWGLPKPTSGVIEGNIGRSRTNRKKMTVLNSGGKEAVTHYRTLSASADIASVVECQLETGRTHQIRVHMAQIGHPLIGDQVYGRGPTKARRKGLTGLGDDISTRTINFPRQALHARSLGFVHPRSGEQLYFNSALPDDIQELITGLGAGIDEK